MTGFWGEFWILQAICFVVQLDASLEPVRIAVSENFILRKLSNCAFCLTFWMSFIYALARAIAHHDPLSITILAIPLQMAVLSHLVWTAEDWLLGKPEMDDAVDTSAQSEKETPS